MNLLCSMFMDHLINLMNNNHHSSLPWFHFPLITNPITFPFHFFTPCSEINYSQDNLCVKMDESDSVLCALQWGFIGLIYSWLLLSLGSDHAFSPFIISYFRSTQTPQVSLNLFSPPYSLINSKTICMDWIAWVWYILSQIYFIFLKSCHVWLFKRLFIDWSRMQDEFFHLR